MPEQARNIRAEHVNNKKKEVFLNFIIYECYGIFGTPYYTIINPESNVHVHSKTIKIAYIICQEADFFLKYGSFRTDHIDIMNRASKLAIRTIPNPRKKKDNNVY